MDQRTPVEEWFPGPQKIDQPYPIINDTSGIPLKAELVVPPPDQVSKGGCIECLGVLKLPMPDPEHWLPDGSYVTVKISSSPAESHQSSPSRGSICDGNSEKNYWYGETREYESSVTSECDVSPAFTGNSFHEEIACDPEDPTNKDTNIPLTTLSGGWNYPNTDTLYFFFENVTFPKAGIFRVKFEIVMMGYRDRYDRPHENDYYPFLKSNFWNYEDIPDEEKMEEYKKTGFRAGVLVAGEDTIVSDEPDWRGMNDPANWISGSRARAIIEMIEEKKRNCIKVLNNNLEPETPLPT
ncbi:hypothetical protein B0H65DRAFT_539134 [Neurospora tetraspora]|uniref:Uncharacterized protein n=1 Tax=Neurospora tetraspora TaxID=94610 RepID=A0AAE0JE22_9PEZI|nr:hypothetical protein B0H65DRAFT_539134 [Neurospora tetraspora]